VAAPRDPMTTTSQQKFTLCLCLFWFLNLIVSEIVVFRLWTPVFPSKEMNEKQQIDHNVLIIGDPQLTDAFSYSFMKEYPNSWISRFVIFISDLYMKRNFVNIMRANRHAPVHAIVFMGDIFDGGRYMDDEQFEYSLKRYRSIFYSPAKVPIIHVAGNHDVNIVTSDYSDDYFESRMSHIVERFEKHFNNMSSVILLQSPSGWKFKFISICAPFLEIDSSAQIQRKNKFPNFARLMLQYHDKAWSFISKELFENQDKNTKSILFTHIPLYRSNKNSDCGRYRKTRSIFNKKNHLAINQGSGIGYKNMLDEETTRKLIQSDRGSANIVRVFSGDDHSNCEHNHEDDYGIPLIENTVGTFSFLQGAYYPSVGMLQTLSDGTLHFDSHFLVSQWNVYLWHMICGIITILIAFIVPLYKLLPSSLHNLKKQGKIYEDIEDTVQSVGLISEFKLTEDNTTIRRKTFPIESYTSPVAKNIKQPGIHRVIGSIVFKSLICILFTSISSFSTFLIIAQMWFYLY
jgi:predicted MPP superfamily phosphohydrolase